MSEGAISRPLMTGDPNDDDGAVIDSFLTETDNPPPTVPSTPTVMVPVPPDTRPETGRLLTGRAQLINAAGPGMMLQTLILPADKFRSGLQVRASGGAGTDAVFLADDPGKLTLLAAGLLPSGGWQVFPIDGQVTIPGTYTGPLYATAEGASAPMYLSWVAVTM